MLQSYKPLSKDGITKHLEDFGMEAEITNHNAILGLSGALAASYKEGTAPAHALYVATRPPWLPWHRIAPCSVAGRLLRYPSFDKGAQTNGGPLRLRAGIKSVWESWSHMGATGSGDVAPPSRLARRRTRGGLAGADARPLPGTQAARR